MKNTGNNASQPLGYRVIVQSKLNEYADPEIHYFKMSDYPEARNSARAFKEEMAKNKNLKVTCTRYY